LKGKRRRKRNVPESFGLIKRGNEEEVVEAYNGKGPPTRPVTKVNRRTFTRGVGQEREGDEKV